MLDSLRDLAAVWWSRLWNSPLAQRNLARYRGMEERDQFAIKILLLFFAAVLIYVLIITPAKDFAKASKGRYVKNESTLHWMQANQDVFTTSVGKAVAAREGQSLLSLASNTAKNFGMSFKRFEPADGNALRLWLDDVNFNDLVQWIEALDKSYNIAVREISVDPSLRQGLVSAKIVLQE
jgi:general secretion pathway protein M